jgi:hypothetical protein
VGAAVLIDAGIKGASIRDVVTGHAAGHPLDVSAATGAVPAGTVPPMGSSGTSSPFPGGWKPSRADMGYDGTFAGSIVAPVSGTITYASNSFSNWGGYLQLKADSGFGLDSQTLYFAEGLSPTVKVGQHVSIGDQIATPAASPWNGIMGNIEWGLAADPSGVGTPTNPLAETGVGSPQSTVYKFLNWAETTLGLPQPTSISGAGYA